MDAPIRILGLAGWLFLGLGGAAVADGLPDFSMHADSSTGWTSNAGNDAFGLESLYARQSGEVSAIVEGDGFVLRGSLGGTQTRFLDAGFENDRGAHVGLTLDYQLAPETVLRGSIGLKLDENGSALDLGGVGVPTLTLSRQLDVDATLVQTFDRLEVALDLGHTNVVASETVFPGLGLAPQRLDPGTYLYVAGLRAAYRLEAPVALLGEVSARHLEIPAADQMRFGRLPVTVVRVAAGAQTTEGAAKVSAKAGGDFVLAQALGGAAMVLPYVELDAAWAVSDNFALTAGGSAQTFLSSPADAVADWTLAASLGAQWQAFPDVSVSGHVFAEQDRSSVSQAVVEIRRGFGFNASKALGADVTAGFSGSYVLTDYGSGSYDRARFGIDLAAMI